MKTTVRLVLIPTLLAAPALTSTAFFNAPAVAFAAPAANFKIPGGAQDFNEDESRFSGLLRELAKEGSIALEPSDENAQTWLWKGGNYKPERATFMKSALFGALDEAGYSVKDYDTNTLRTNLFTYFPTDQNRPFEPDSWKLPTYFSAIDRKTNRGFLGVLIQSSDALALGLLPLKISAPKVESLPALPTGAWLVKDGNNAMKGLSPSKAPTFAPMARVARTARGQVKNATGKPLAGAIITVQSSVVGGLATLHRGQTDRNGVYNIRLSTGIARISSAVATVSFAGKNYGLPLHPVDGNSEQFDSASGHVENFTLQTSGATNPQSANDPGNPQLYFGGSLRLSWRSEISPGGTFEVTLKPDGPLLDGTVGRTFVYRFANTNGRIEAPLNNIPLGRYKLSARLLMDGDAAPLRVAPFPSDDVASSTSVVFEPVSATQPDLAYSGVRTQIITIRP